LTSDGKPYGPIRYKQIVNECYTLTKNAGVTYSDVMGMTPVEREYYLDFLQAEYQRQQEQIERARASAKAGN